MWPFPSNSGKSRFSSGFPTKNVIMKKVTVTGKGPYPIYIGELTNGSSTNPSPEPPDAGGPGPAEAGEQPSHAHTRRMGEVFARRVHLKIAFFAVKNGDFLDFGKQTIER